MKKIIAIVVAAVLVIGIGCLVVWMNETEYTGVCSFSIAGESRQLKLAEVNRVDRNGRANYTALFSEGGDSFRISFAMWVEDGECWMDVDNPSVQIDGMRYTMTRPVDGETVEFSASDTWVEITFWELPFNDGYTLNGQMTLMVSGDKLC